MINFGNRLRSLRNSAGMTQLQLGNRIHVSKSLVSSYERGMKRPSYETLVKLASIYHVSTDYLLGIEKCRTLDISHLTEEQAAAIRTLVSTMGPGEPK